MFCFWYRSDSKEEDTTLDTEERFVFSGPHLCHHHGGHSRLSASAFHAYRMFRIRTQAPWCHKLSVFYACCAIQFFSGTFLMKCFAVFNGFFQNHDITKNLQLILPANKIRASKIQLRSNLDSHCMKTACFPWEKNIG